MKGINDYIFENSVNTILSEIDADIICEKLTEPHLLDLAKWFKGLNDKNMTFGKTLGYLDVEWDKIKTSDFDYYTKGDKKGTSIAVKTCPSNNIHDEILVLFVDENDKIQYYIKSYGNLVTVNNNKYVDDYAYKEGSWYAKDYTKPIKRPANPSTESRTIQRDIRELCKQYDFMILDLSNKMTQSRRNLRNKRYEAQKGMITPDMYGKIARENIERYREIIARNKAEKIAQNDELSERVEYMLTQVMQLSQTIIKGGAKYADLEYNVGSLLGECYGERHYNNKHHTTYGSDGLLTLYASYVGAIMNNSQKHVTYVQKPEEYAKKIEYKLDSIQKHIDKILEKL